MCYPYHFNNQSHVEKKIGMRFPIINDHLRFQHVFALEI